MRHPFSAVSFGSLAVTAVLSLGMAGSAMAQTQTQSANTGPSSVRAMTIQEARQEAREVFRTDQTQEAWRLKSLEPYGTRVQRQRKADRKAKKCENALKRLQAAHPSEDITDKPVPFACR